jgi:hypothetical protein
MTEGALLERISLQEARSLGGSQRAIRPTTEAELLEARLLREGRELASPAMPVRVAP